MKREGMPSCESLEILGRLRSRVRGFVEGARAFLRFGFQVHSLLFQELQSIASGGVVAFDFRDCLARFCERCLRFAFSGFRLLEYLLQRLAFRRGLGGCFLRGRARSRCFFDPWTSGLRQVMHLLRYPATHQIRVG